MPFYVSNEIHRKCFVYVTVPSNHQSLLKIHNNQKNTILLNSDQNRTTSIAAAVIAATTAAPTTLKIDLNSSLGSNQLHYNQTDLVNMRLLFV